MSSWIVLCKYKDDSCFGGLFTVFRKNESIFLAVSFRLLRGCSIGPRWWCSAVTTSLGSLVCKATSSIAVFRTMSESRRELCSVVGSVDVVKPAWVRKIGVHNLLRVDEEVLSGSRDTRVFIPECSNKDYGIAVVVELPVQGTLRADTGLV